MGLPKETLANPIFLPPGLFTEIERLDDCSVALDIDLFQILQQLAALADQLLEYLKEIDIERYRAIIKTLNLRK